MDNTLCAKEDCNKPAYTGSCIIVDLPIGKVDVFFCDKHLAEMFRLKTLMKLFVLEKEIKK